MQKQVNVKWWDLLIVLGIVVILIWALLKSLGVIHSPVWVEMIPYFGIIAAFIGAVYKLGMVMETINTIKIGMEKLLSMENRILKLESEHTLLLAGKLKVEN